jgi:hypothetical protein
MADRKLIAANIERLPKSDNVKLIIMGFSDDCNAAADILREKNRELFAWASDDVVFVINKNKSNIIFAERYAGGIDIKPIEIYEYQAAIRVKNAVFLISTDHYQRLLEAAGLLADINFFRINAR